LEVELEVVDILEVDNPSDGVEEWTCLEVLKLDQFHNLGREEAVVVVELVLLLCSLAVDIL
jgi:hypothetical protein